MARCRPLVELCPVWIVPGDGPRATQFATEAEAREFGREPVGVEFDCPCGCEARIGAMFQNCPPERNYIAGDVTWDRQDSGFSFATLSFRPSLDCSKGGGPCTFHGHVGLIYPGVVSW